MSKLVAVSVAVGGELTGLRWWPPRNLDAVMGNDYHFDQDSMTSFLILVRHKLETGIGDVYTFDFDATFARAAVGMKVGELIGAIEERTRSLGTANLLMVDPGMLDLQTVAMRKSTSRQVRPKPKVASPKPKGGVRKGAGRPKPEDPGH